MKGRDSSGIREHALLERLEIFREKSGTGVMHKTEEAILKLCGVNMFVL